MYCSNYINFTLPVACLFSYSLMSVLSQGKQMYEKRFGRDMVAAHPNRQYQNYCVINEKGLGYPTAMSCPKLSLLILIFLSQTFAPCIGTETKHTASSLYNLVSCSNGYSHQALYSLQVAVSTLNLMFLLLSVPQKINMCN